MDTSKRTMSRRACCGGMIGALALVSIGGLEFRRATARTVSPELGELASVVASGVQAIDGERVWRATVLEAGTGGVEIAGPVFVMTDEAAFRLETSGGDVVNLLGGREAQFVPVGKTLVARGDAVAELVLFELAEPGSESRGDVVFESETFSVAPGLHDTELVWAALPGQMGTSISGYEAAWAFAPGGAITVLPQRGNLTELTEGGSVLLDGAFGLANVATDVNDIIGVYVLGIGSVIDRAESG